jgi:hypothetical protein
MPAALAPQHAPPTGAADRRLALALAASAALHLALALWSGGAPLSAGARIPAPASSLLFTAHLSPPRAAAAERHSPLGEGGGNSERPGHAESVVLPASEDLPVPPADASAARLRAGDSLNLPTDRTLGSNRQAASRKDLRQARSESSRGSAERGGDDCRVAGFRFCSS